MRIGIINVGASAFRMYIGEYVNGESKCLDFLIKPLRIGMDTFTQGYIGIENVKKATEILKIFKLKLDEYKISKYRAVCTSGVREASNKDFFLDYTHIHSGIKLEILDPSEEIYIKYVGARNSVKNFIQLEQEGLVFANVASGNVTLNITSKNCLVYSGTLPYGSLRLRQMFKSIPHLKRHKAIEEHVRTMIFSIYSAISPDIKLNHLVGAGSSVNLMLRLFGNDPDRTAISYSEVQGMYEKVRAYSHAELSVELGLRKDEASVLLPMLITYLELMRFAGAKEFSFSRLTFPNTLALHHSGQILDNHLKSRIRNSLFMVAGKYGANKAHAKWVSHFARKLFDGLKELHSLGSSARLILEASAILYEVGKYVSSDNVAENSYFITKSLKLPGMEKRTLIMAAHTLYNTYKKDNPSLGTDDELTSQERLTVKKLAAILRIAISLDAGKARLVKNIEIVMNDHITILATTEREPYLEIYTFEKERLYFMETFGIKLELRARIDYE